MSKIDIITIILVIVIACLFLFGCCPGCQYGYQDDALANDRAWLRTESTNQAIDFQTDIQMISSTLNRTK